MGRFLWMILLSFSSKSKALLSELLLHRVFSVASQNMSSSLSLRRSARLLKLPTAALNDCSDFPHPASPVPLPSALRKKRKVSSDSNAASVSSEVRRRSLPRKRESQIKARNSEIRHIMGIDEAGRGPLAGPVVAAAVIVPTDIAGVVDSKKVVQETERELLYEAIIASPSVRWAVAVVDAATIDEINILQATLLGMRMAAQAVVRETPHQKDRVLAPCVSRKGCYVSCGGTDVNGRAIETLDSIPDEHVYALLDGNKVPKDMPCGAESIIKGDSSEFSIAAASIFAKVTRDKLMHGYAALYPEYNLHQHKGYPTAAHMTVVRTWGATPIHRRTFAPLKHMEFDGEGRVVST